MKKLSLSLLLGICSVSSFAATKAASSAVAFSIESNQALTVPFLDSAWSNRENLNNQKIIAEYLNTNPEVSKDYEIAWKTARLVYFIGNYGYGEKKFVGTSSGVKLFDYGVSAAKIAREVKSDGVEGLYWFAIDLGSYGLAKGIMSSASNAGAGMDALKQVNALQADFQWYGGSRILGKYYQELPGLFGGSNKKALELLTTATTKAPNFRNNWVFLGQYYNSTGEADKALDACQKALQLPNQDGKYEEIRYSREAQECVDKAKAKLGKD